MQDMTLVNAGVTDHLQGYVTTGPLKVYAESQNSIL